MPAAPLPGTTPRTRTQDAAPDPATADEEAGVPPAPDPALVTGVALPTFAAVTSVAASGAEPSGTAPVTTGGPAPAVAAGKDARTAADRSHGRTPAPSAADPATPATPATSASPAASADPATPATPATSATPATTTATPIAATTSITAPGPAPAAPSVQLDQVTSQVFGEVTGLVSRGTGTHRITLTLNPEQLGEVRVVMTVRSGAVHVRLAAGHEARTSLVEGSPELARMLEHAGATETRVVVRELPQGVGQAGNQTSTPPTTASSSGSPWGAGTDRSPDQHAGTRADHPARDGAEHHRQHRSTVPPEVRPTQQVTEVRAAGVDLTM